MLQFLNMNLSKTPEVVEDRGARMLQSVEGSEELTWMSNWANNTNTPNKYMSHVFAHPSADVIT